MTAEDTAPSMTEVLTLRGDSVPDENDDAKPLDSRTGDERVVTADIHESRYRLLVPVLAESTAEETERLFETAAALVHDREGDLLVQCLVRVPGPTPTELLTEDDSFIRERHEMAEQLLEAATTHGISADAVVSLTGEEARAVLGVADQYNCDGILLEVSGDRSQRRRLLAGDAVEKIEARAECDVFVEKPAVETTALESILLTVSGGPHSGLATETARAVALHSGARIDAVHFMSDSADEEGVDEVLRATAGILNEVERTTVDLVTTDRVGEEIVTRSAEYDLTVLGAPTMGLLRQFVFGTVPDSVAQNADEAVLMVKRATGNTSAYARWIAGDQPTSTEWSAYQCQSCGETFEKRRQVCPNCGGYDIRREWPEDL